MARAPSRRAWHSPTQLGVYGSEVSARLEDPVGVLSSTRLRGPARSVGPNVPEGRGERHVERPLEVRSASQPEAQLGLYEPAPEPQASTRRTSGPDRLVATLISRAAQGNRPAAFPLDVHEAMAGLWGIGLAVRQR